MKRVISIALVIFLFCSFSPIAFAERRNNKSKMINAFPCALEEIGEEAFSGTAINTVFLPYGLKYIGEKAFAASWDLNDVYIPETVDYIGDFAFPLNKGIKIYGAKGSCAQEWAVKNQILFIPEFMWNLRLKKMDVTILFESSAERLNQLVKSVNKIGLRGRGEDRYKSLRPQDRPELNPIDYKFP